MSTFIQVDFQDATSFKFDDKELTVNFTDKDIVKFLKNKSYGGFKAVYNELVLSKNQSDFPENISPAASMISKQ